MTETETDHPVDIEQFFQEALPILKEGWLFKKKQRGVQFGSLFRWQKRYFVFDNARSELAYGTDAQHHQKRSIRFDELDRVARSRTVAPKEGKRGILVAAGLQFEIHCTPHAHHHNENRTFILQAETTKDVDEWIRILKNASIQHNPHSSHPKGSSLRKWTSTSPQQGKGKERVNTQITKAEDDFITPIDMSYPRTRTPPPSLFCFCT